MAINNSNRKILHLDLDAFYCAVEERANPALRGKAFAVGGKPDERGVVASCSYAARMKGIHSAMPMGQALSLYRGLMIVAPNHERYSQASGEVMERLNNLSPLVEQISIDEAFIDVSDLREDAETIARRLQLQINQELNLPCSLGVATNKLVAKIANDEGKRRNKSENPPNAITVVAPGSEASFLGPLPVIALWGVGPKSAERFNLLGMKFISDIARRPARELERIFGKVGHDLSLRSQGIDYSPVTNTHETKSISQETTFNKDQNDPMVLKKVLFELSEGVGRRMRKEGLQGKTIKLKLRWSDFTTLSRQATLTNASDQDRDIYTTAAALFDKEWQANLTSHRRVRLIGVGITGFARHEQQMELWETSSTKGRKLQNAVDVVREKFGSTAILRGKPK